MVVFGVTLYKTGKNLRKRCCCIVCVTIGLLCLACKLAETVKQYPFVLFCLTLVFIRFAADKMVACALVSKVSQLVN